MNKKYLSVILFGALMLGTTGTFTSCKDYDDDITNLQQQITANADAIKALQDLVNAGNYVTGVSIQGNVITFTFSNGSPATITIPEGEKGQTVVVKDGELYIDDEPTGIKVAEAAEEGLVKAEGGTWWVLGEDGKYADTGIPVSGVTVSGSEKDGYTFTIYDENGTPQTVKLPTAVSSITELTLGKKTINPATGLLKEDGRTTYTAAVNDFLISREKFTFNPTAAVTADGITAASKWLGNKTLPNNDDYIYASPTAIDLRVDPVNVSAENIKFYLTNTKNADLYPVVLTAAASQDSNNPPMGVGNVNTRAAVTGNGLWTLTMANTVVGKNVQADTWTAIQKAAGGEYAQAVNADHGFRSRYELKVACIAPEELDQLSIKGVEGTFTTDLGETTSTDMGTSATADDITFKTGVAYKVNGVQASALYDMYLTADQSDRDVYGLSFDQDKHTFTIGKNPDVSSIPAEFDLIVYTVANDGVIEKTVITILINSQISAPAEYGLHEHDVNKSANDNYFGIDLATMKTALGDNLNQWIQNVDLTAAAITYKWSDDGVNWGNLPAGIAAMVVEKTDKVNKATATTDRNKANYIQVNVDNSTVNGLLLDWTYYIKVTFKAVAASGAGELNSIVVPVQFHAPALSELFTKKTAYLDKTNDVINAYFYQTARTGQNNASTAVTLARYFSDYVSDAFVSFTNDKVGETNLTGEQLFEMKWTANGGTSFVSSSTPNATVYFGKDNSVENSNEQNYATIDFDANKAGINNKGQGQNGYGEVVTVKVNKAYYNNVANTTTGWYYIQTGDNEYSFKIRLMSPIYEGSVNPVSGNTINISANDWVNGARITDAMIKGADYNKNTYNVVPDKFVANATAWANPQIANVTPERDDENLIKTVTVAAATQKDGNTVNGAFVVKGENITNTTEVKMPVKVKDVWGYILEEKVSVTIQMND